MKLLITDGEVRRLTWFSQGHLGSYCHNLLITNLCISPNLEAHLDSQLKTVPFGQLRACWKQIRRHFFEVHFLLNFVFARISSTSSNLEIQQVSLGKTTIVTYHPLHVTGGRNDLHITFLDKLAHLKETDSTLLNRVLFYNVKHHLQTLDYSTVKRCRVHHTLDVFKSSVPQENSEAKLMQFKTELNHDIFPKLAFYSSLSLNRHSYSPPTHSLACVDVEL